MIDNREVGRRIARLRQERCLTQMQLAAMMNVSHQAVSKWESGAAMPDIQTLLELTRFFGLTVEQLTGADAQEEPMEPEEVPDAAPNAAEEAFEEDFAREDAGHPAQTGEAPGGEGETDKQKEDRGSMSHMNIKQLLQMAPFMSKEVVAEIALDIEEPMSGDDLARLAPFLPQEAVEALVRKHRPQLSWENLRRIAPHMRRETVDELARTIASGQETIHASEDSFNRTMNDLGRAFDGLGRGMDKAVRRALRIGEIVLIGVGSALSGLASDAADAKAERDSEAKARSERMRELRRRAFERALDENRWDWLGEHIDELEDGDELRRRIAQCAREQGMRDWLDEFMDGGVDEDAVEAALRSGDWDWLGEHIDEFEPDLQLRVARDALEARRWSWLEEHIEEIDLDGESAANFAREAWRGGERELAAHIASETFSSSEQYDALATEAFVEGDLEMAKKLWEGVSEDCAGAQLQELAKQARWSDVEELIDRADAGTLESLMEQAVEQANFEAVDFLDDYL